MSASGRLKLAYTMFNPSMYYTIITRAMKMTTLRKVSTIHRIDFRRSATKGEKRMSKVNIETGKYPRYTQEHPRNPISEQ